MESTPAAPALRRRPLGRTGLDVTEIGLGGARLGGQLDESASLSLLARAFQLGVNFVDTSDAYGRGLSETLLGKALKAAPRRVLVATKAGQVRREQESPHADFSPEYLRQACDRSLNRLGVTCIDVFQLHNPACEVLEQRQVWDTLRGLKDRGKIAYYGASVGSPEDARRAIEFGEVEVLQVPYNLLQRDAASELFALCARHEVGLIVREPLRMGLLAGKYAAGHAWPEGDPRRANLPPDRLQAEIPRVRALKFLAAGRSLAQAALKFCLTPEAVSCVIPGVMSVPQLEENVAAAFVPDLTPDELKRIETV